MVFIHKRERAVRLDAVGKIWISAGNENQIAFERSMLVDGASSVNACMKAIIRTKLCQNRAFGERLRRRSWHKELVAIERIHDLAGVQRIKLDAKVGMRKLRAADDILNAFCERVF